ncbi:uncharacterized protein LOC108024476 [Drosophila biarmipes]|uniref:uncharacterized protein LOC108024476 n=1 Tax=Drosophila biarmipes TaxID=125945 RepID=UPI0007E7385F|nr:uncharacterized protein LOC108024476 [Drosophila biarmipes]
MKAYISVCLIFSIVLTSGNAACPETEDVVWALDIRRNYCENFRNKCYFEEETYTGFNITTKEKCQIKCRTNCIRLTSSTKATYRGVTRVFTNDCFRLAHNCRTGETYV